VTGLRKRGQSLTRLPVSFDATIQPPVPDFKGKGRSLTHNMADLESGPGQSSPRMSVVSGIGPALTFSSSQSSIRGSAVDPLSDPALEWGPAHPCFPHLNPHVPTSSPEYKSTRIIRIRRDWMIEGDLAPTFSGIYPEVLADAGLGEGEFRRMVETLNNDLIPASSPWAWRNVLDATFGLLTGWIWDDLGFTATKMKLRSVEGRLEQWNEKAKKEGVAARWVPLRRSAYLTVCSPHFPLQSPFRMYPARTGSHTYSQHLRLTLGQ
jgi:hypothetical protein